MSVPRRTPISPRKQPQQARSAELVATILEAAIQVLTKDGAERFTTARVAERAGVSVGSVYQYFPNKAAILFRLQTDEWQRTAEMLRGILEDDGEPPLARLRLLVHAFIRSEFEEAEMRTALSGAAPLYRDAPEARDARAASASAVRVFMEEALPEASKAKRALAGSLITRTLSTVGKQLTAKARSDAEVGAYADAMADMFCAYLMSLQQP
jgi:AcrR family transcriptional regulator